MNKLEKSYRFVWRLALNMICSTAAGRKFLYPPAKLASRFGRGDASYAWSVFQSHLSFLESNGFVSAYRVLEVGPGRNLGTALLFWSFLSSRVYGQVKITCWDVYKNAATEDPEFWRLLADELHSAALNKPEILDKFGMNSTLEMLRSVAIGMVTPSISYEVAQLDDFKKDKETFDLVYSQAAIEHIWFINNFWEAMSLLSSSDGWHSHRIDLADHGRRDTNYIEMLQWSDLAYWATQRFMPGAINRWRASGHIKKLESIGFTVVQQRRQLREAIPVPRAILAKAYRSLDEENLRTTGLDIVAKKKGC